MEMEGVNVVMRKTFGQHALSALLCTQLGVLRGAQELVVMEWRHFPLGEVIFIIFIIIGFCHDYRNEERGKRKKKD